MVRSLYLLALLPALALAHEGEHEGEVEHGTTLVLPSNIEQFPTIINDLSSYQTSAFLSTFPTGTLEPNPYPTGSASAPPSYGTGSAVPYPSSSGTSDQAPTATVTATEAPVATTTMATSPVYAPPPAESSAAGGNATGSAAPAPTQIAAGNTFTVKLPVVLGALGLVFAML